ncbi:MAG: hypothetical protein Q9227_006220 [Pyrenula ochraceoflavens]
MAEKLESSSPPGLSQDGATPIPFEHDDDLENDVGDLDFSNSDRNLWLTKLPVSLWNVLSNLKDDDEIELGTLRVEGDFEAPKRVSLKLNDIPVFKTEPKEYLLQNPDNVKTGTKRPKNTYVFSEKDLPGYKRRKQDLADEEAEALGPIRSNLYADNLRDARRKANKGRFVPSSRKAIPKKTALTGTVTRDYNIQPVENAEYAALLDSLTRDSLKPPPETEIQFSDLKSAHFQMPGTTAYISARNLNRPTNTKPTDNRAARMERPALVQGLLRLFSEYRFWGLREIKGRINQPEAFLRETLDSIAILHRQGDAVGKWELRSEYKDRGEGAAAATAAAGGGNGGSSGGGGMGAMRGGDGGAVAADAGAPPAVGGTAPDLEDDGMGDDGEEEGEGEFEDVNV